MRRRATILLHWSAFVLLVLLMAGGPTPVIAWAFITVAALKCTLALTLGLMNRPGPKLEGPARTLHPWQSRAMYALLAFTAFATWRHLTGTPLPGPTLAELYFYLFATGWLHGIFHLWRHTALRDGALRRITPRAMHGML